MNSIFSSFDALCAELLGQTFRPYFNSTTEKGGKNFLSRGVLTDKVVSETMKKENREEGNVEKKRQKAPMPRFAPELDGLNCFETLVSH